jgi:hypothetical protein
MRSVWIAALQRYWRPALGFDILFFTEFAQVGVE